jgi:hypothetical protein
MAALAGITLIWPATPLGGLWALNPDAYAELAPLGRSIGLPFLVLSLTLAMAATGWFRRTSWGWQLATAIIALQIAGNLITLARGEVWKGTVGALLAGALLFYLLRPPVRAAFRGVAS